MITISIPSVNTRQQSIVKVSYTIDNGPAIEKCVKLKPLGSISRKGQLFVLLGNKGVYEEELVPQVDYSSIATLRVTNFKVFAVSTLTRFQLCLLFALGKDIENLVFEDNEPCASVLRKCMDYHNLTQMVVGSTLFGSIQELTDNLHGKLANALHSLNVSANLFNNCRKYNSLVCICCKFAFTCFSYHSAFSS